MFKNLLEPFKYKQISALLIGQLTSKFGDSIMKLMLPLIVYSITGSLLSMGLIMSIMIVPEVFLLPVTGIIVDRYSRKNLMILSDVIRFLLLSILTILSLCGLLNIYAIYFYAFVSGIVNSLFEPAYSALKAQIFKEDIRNSANALSEISNQFVTLLGPVIGGIFASLHIYSLGFGIDALTFLGSVLSLLCIKVYREAEKEKEPKFSLHVFGAELKEGYYEINKHDFIKITIFVGAFVNIIISSFVNISLPYFMKNILNLPDFYYGIAMSFFSIGSICMATFLGSRNQINKRGIMTYMCFGLIGSFIAGLLLFKNVFALILCLMLMGVTVTLMMLIWYSSMQELISEKNFGKVSSLDNFGSFTLLPVGYILVGYTSQKIGISQTMLIESLFMMAFGFLMIFNSKIRKFD
ncbi:MFS transporter [Desulfosporosinus sp. SYSU MS00001]|uniref:MFS transporter n=1 Tax=Desulfosporosinus sp. SYSU MS00001 TaxID=3416284 RepID=UPI003CE8BAC1